MHRLNNAMAYLNIDLDYPDHPKTKRLVGLCGRGSELLPFKLWTYCGKFHPEDGMLMGYSAKEIESIAGWWGKSGDCVQALVKCGFLEELKDVAGIFTGYRVHQWKEHQGHIWAFKLRAIEANRKRWSENPDPPPTGSPTGSPCEANKESSCCTVPAVPTSTGTHTHTAQAREVEFPPGFPESEDRAVAEAAMVGVPEAKLRQYWLDAAGRGGMDGRGQPVRKWAQHAKGRWSWDQNNDAKKAKLAEANGKVRAYGKHQPTSQSNPRNFGQGETKTDFAAIIAKRQQT